MLTESSIVNRPPHASPIALIAADIKIAHSVFALPFAILAAFMAATPGGVAPDWVRFAGQLALVTLAMVSARTVAMLANRWLDREIDARNPRTVRRALPSGQLSAATLAGVMLYCAVGFLFVCALFGLVFDNWWPAILGMPVLVWISAYGYLKRFTALCHLYLGSSLAISPIAAAIAIDPHAIMQQPALWLLSAMVLCWVAGFDIIYALQDVEVDRAQNLYSIPARLGVRNALWVSRLLHALAAACLFALALIDDRFGVVFFIGCVIVVMLLIYEQLTVSRRGTTKIALAFFTLNGVISCLLGVLGVIDLTLV
jgi:4-hydroxybenzoate polyprenyltransferase